MKKTLCLILLAVFLLVSSTVYAGGYGHHGGGYRGYGGGYYGGHGGGYYGGHVDTMAAMGGTGPITRWGLPRQSSVRLLLWMPLTAPVPVIVMHHHLLFTVMVTGKSREPGYRALRSATGSTSIMTRTVMSGCWGTGRNARGAGLLAGNKGLGTINKIILQQQPVI